ncbi:MAG: glycosyltransferase family 4 protein [Nanoarchaeota archaeon]
MRILLIAHDYPPRIISGLGKYSENLVKELNARDHDVTLITGQMPEQEIKEVIPAKNGHNISIIRIPLPQGDILDKIIPNFFDKRIFFNNRIKKFFTKNPRFFNDFDLVHCMDENNSYWLNTISPNIPVVTSINAYYAISTSWNPLRYYDWNADTIIKYFYYNIMKYRIRNAMTKADLLIANSVFTKNQVANNSKISKKKILVVYRGIDFSQFKNINIPENKYENHNILFVGRNMERKGVIYLLKSMPLIIKEFPDTKITIIGMASLAYRRRMHWFIKKNNLQKSVILIPYKDNPELVDYYLNANVFVMPSLIEGFGQVIVEAMATMTPVIGSNSGGIPEVIKSHGTIINPKSITQIASAIISIFKNPSNSFDTAIKAYEYSKRSFDYKIMTDETLKVYGEVLQCKNT